MERIQDMLSYGFMHNAILAAVLCGIVCGIVGTYIVCRRVVFLGGGITHASFGGIGAAYYLGLDPVCGAGVFALLSALVIERVSHGRGSIREDSAIGIVWSVGMALGVMFIYMTPGYAPNLMNYLFGSILTVSRANIILLGVMCLILCAVFTLMPRAVMYVAFDRTFSRSQGMPVAAVGYVMAALTALAIVLCIRSVGIIMLLSLLTFPAVVASCLTRSFLSMIPIACAVAVVADLLGLALSCLWSVPSSAATIFLLALALGVAKTLKFVGCRRLRRAADKR